MQAQAPSVFIGGGGFFCYWKLRMEKGMKGRGNEELANIISPFEER